MASPDLPQSSRRLLIYLAPGDVAMFRFLLEAHDNLALFTVLERKTALLKLCFAAQSEAAVIAMLREIGQTVPLKWQPWPFV